MRKIDHLNLKVKDIEKAIEFYTQTLGFTLTWKLIEENRKFAFLNDGTITYEIIEDKNFENGTFDHIAYVSEDIYADFEHFKALDESMIACEVGFAPFLFENGMYYFFIKGANGEKIEFCQRKA